VSIAPDGTDETVVVGPSDGFQQASGILASPSGAATYVSDDQYLATEFEPLLDFDSTEKWRPLNAEMFLNEQDPSTGLAWNQICVHSTGSCTGLTGERGLQVFGPSSDSYIQIHNSDGTEDGYDSPDPDCHSTVGNTHVLDCGTGLASAIYYNVTGPSPGGYTYVNYWFFYRNNQGPVDVGNHAGDWEGVTVAPTDDGSTFAFAEFSEHGEWHSYLRDELQCDGQGEGSCGTENAGTTLPATPDYYGQHVMTFPAAGSHANYAVANQGDNVADNGNDGGALWGRNWDPTASVATTCPANVPDASDAICGPALIETPVTAGQGADWLSGPGQWTDWPGDWGQDSDSPCSPAGAPRDGCGNDHADHFFEPWSTDANLNCPTPIDLQGNPLPDGTACPRARGRQAQQLPLTCGSWFGDATAALVCDQPSMRIAVGRRTLTRRGAFTLAVRDRRGLAATAPGLAQLVGAPLRPGEQATVTGTIPAGTTIAVRASTGARTDVGVYRQHARFHGTLRLTVIGGAGKWPKVRVAEGHRHATMTVTSRHRRAPSRMNP
jgi:hypothetical protein